jgi:hypothetical protein
MYKAIVADLQLKEKGDFKSEVGSIHPENYLRRFMSMLSFNNQDMKAAIELANAAVPQVCLERGHHSGWGFPVRAFVVAMGVCPGSWGWGQQGGCLAGCPGRSKQAVMLKANMPRDLCSKARLGSVADSSRSSVRAMRAGASSPSCKCNLQLADCHCAMPWLAPIATARHGLGSSSQQHSCSQTPSTCPTFTPFLRLAGGSRARPAASVGRQEPHFHCGRHPVHPGHAAADQPAPQAGGHLRGVRRGGRNHSRRLQGHVPLPGEAEEAAGMGGTGWPQGAEGRG